MTVQPTAPTITRLPDGWRLHSGMRWAMLIDPSDHLAAHAVRLEPGPPAELLRQMFARDPLLRERMRDWAPPPPIRNLEEFD